MSKPPSFQRGRESTALPSFPRRRESSASDLFFNALDPRPRLRGGRLCAYPELPNVPTLVESGFPALDLPVWFAVYAPAATPAPALARLRAALATLTATPAYGADLAKRGAIVMKVPVEASEAMFARERTLWADAVRSTGASAD